MNQQKSMEHTILSTFCSGYEPYGIFDVKYLGLTAPYKDEE